MQRKITTRTIAVLTASISTPLLADPPLWVVQPELADTLNGIRPLATDAAANSYILATSELDDIVVAKYAPDGSMAWVREWDGPAPGNDQDLGVAIAATPDGSAIYALGRASMPGFANSDMAVLKYDADGNLIWEAFYDGPASGIDDPKALALHPDGGVVVTGLIWNDDERGDYGTARFDADGNLLWSAIFGDNGRFLFNDDSARVVAVNDAGDVFISGNTSPPTNTNDIVTISYDGATGAQRWLTRYDGTSNDTVRAIALGPDGSVHIAGRQAGFDGAYVAVKYDADTGAERWVAVRDPGFDDFLTDLAVAPNGDVFVTGVSDPDSDDSNTNDDAVTIAFRADDGEFLWQDRFGGRQGAEFDRGSRLLIDSAGRLRLFGTSSTIDITGDRFNRDAIMLTYDPATGVLNDITNVDTSPDGRVARDSFLDASLLPTGDIIAFGTASIEFVRETFLLARFGDGGCPADLDGDGDADADDFFDYLDLFAAGDSAADLDNDGDTDADDFFAYLDAFAAGC